VGDGSHYFSGTLQEHNLAVQKFQLGKKDIRLPAKEQQP
jgi:cell division protein YceG involved in septum cleavage